jgi:hypothetical protein
MARERIRFGIDGIAIEADFDVNHLRFGGVLHVARDGDARSFSATRTANSRPYKIVAVTRRQPEGYRLVGLLNEVYVGDNLGQRVFEATGRTTPREQIDERLRALASEVPFDSLHDAAVVSSSRIKTVESALDRLDLVTVLDREDVGTALWTHHRGIVAYLYLTCFDLLGQNPEWVEFPAWLQSKSKQHADARARAVAAIAPGSDPVTVAQQLHSAYNAVYSVRQGFRRFITEVLPDETRRSLLTSIVAERRVMPPLPNETDPPVPLSENRKIDWLFSIRNQYTHRATYVPGLHDQMTPADMRGDDETWWMSDELSEKSTTAFSVSRWPRVLAECFRAGLLAYVMQQRNVIGGTDEQRG